MDFHFLTTADGSPTLRLSQNGSESEAMHSPKGAFSETAYIYGSAIEYALSREAFAPSVLSLGLGIGYNELLTTAMFLRANKAEYLFGESFEIVPELRDFFIAWLNDANLPREFAVTYEAINELTAKHTGVAAERIRKTLRNMIEEKRWRISNALESTTQFDRRFSCICFDAFSSKTSPDLWDESFLTDFFARACEENCVLSTYACTGALKRSLRASGFTLDIREGFASKRDSTFAARAKLL